MAISFKDKIAYVNKFADKSDEKLQKVIKLSVNIESPKLNLTDAQKDKIKSSLETAFERIKKIEDEKGTTKVEGKKLKSPNLLQLTKQISQKQGITFEEARKKAKQAFAAKKSGQADAIQAVLKDFKKKVGKIEYSRATTYVSKGVTRSTDIKRDMVRPALKAGKRKVTTQGSTTNAYGTFKNKVGKVYYESRANRMDINQPSKKRYPKLAKGAKIYSSDNAYKVQVMVDDKIVDEKIIRARNQREANMLAEEMDGIFTKKYGDHRVKVIEAMGDGGEFDDGGMTNFSDAYVIVKENRDEADDFEGLVFSEEDFSKWLAQKSEEEEEELDEDDYKLISVSVYNPNKMNNGGMTKYQMGVVVHLKAAPKYRYFDDGDRYFYFDDAIDAKNFVLNGVPEAYKYESLIVADLSNQKNQKRYEIKSERDTMGRLVQNTNNINDIFQRIINQQTFSKAYLESLKKSSSGKMPQPDTDMLDYYDSKISNDPSNESDKAKYPTFDDEYYENGGGVKKKYTRPMYPTGSRALTHANLVANKHLIEKRMHKAFSEYRFALMDLVELKKDFYKGMARAESNYAKDNGEEYSKFEKSLTYFADAYGRRFDDGGETTNLKKGSTITILGDEYKIIDFRVDKSQGYDEERVIMRNAEGDTLSYPLDMVMAYSKYSDSRAFSRKAKVGDVIEFQSGYADGSILRHKGKILSKEGQSYIVEVIAGGVMDGTKTYVHESLVTKKFEGGGEFGGGGMLEDYDVTIVYPSKSTRQGWVMNDRLDLKVSAKNEADAKKKAMAEFEKSHQGVNGKITAVTPVISPLGANFDDAIFAEGGMFKVGDKVSSSMFTEGVIESKKKMGDDTMYFVTYQSSENPNKNNSVVLRGSEMTKIGKVKMAKGGMTEHGLRVGDKIIGGKIIGTTIRVRNENRDEDARVDLNTGKRTILDYDAKTKKYVERKADGGKLQYNRRKK